jgi:hypothetical protein
MNRLLESELCRNIIVVCLVMSIIICLILFCLRRNRRERVRVKPGVVVEEVNPLRHEKIVRLI